MPWPTAISMGSGRIHWSGNHREKTYSRLIKELEDIKKAVEELFMSVCTALGTHIRGNTTTVRLPDRQILFLPGKIRGKKVFVILTMMKRADALKKALSLQDMFKG